MLHALGGPESERPAVFFADGHLVHPYILVAVALKRYQVPGRQPVYGVRPSRVRMPGSQDAAVQPDGS